MNRLNKAITILLLATAIPAISYRFAGLTGLFLLAGALVIALGRMKNQKRWQATK